MPQILNSKQLVNKITKELQECVKTMQLTPNLYVFASDDKASQIYINNKIKKGREIGINIIPLKAEILNELGKYISMPFIIQEPTIIGKELKEKILNENFLLDMDGFSSNNLGRLIKGLTNIAPCTPAGILELLKWYNISLEGKNIMIIGRSNIVGKPLAIMMEQANATVTLCHSKTPINKLQEIFYNSDIIVSAVGKYNYLQDIESNAEQILVDVGINKNKQGKTCGDFSSVTLQGCYAYTPVPGGVGPMTVIMLMKNVVDYWQRSLDF